MKFNTKAIHGGQHHDPSTGAVMPPVYQTSTFVQNSPGKPLNPDYEYSRAANPTRTALENALASIENGTRGLAFSSGLAATDCLLRSFKAGMKSLLWMICMEERIECLQEFTKTAA